MPKFIVNNKEYDVAEEKTLLRFLRDDLKLKSVKDGCSEGACGTCTVLVDGKATRACIPKLSKLEGKSVLTVEGLSIFEKDAFVQAFADAGSVQCGFCIPGMVMAGKGLLDKNSDPTFEEVQQAIRTNICRCTGYKKIIDGILLAAKIIRGEEELSSEDKNVELGVRMRRIDVKDKVLGTGEYVDDVEMEGMVYGTCIRTKYPRAKVVSIDKSEAEALEGVEYIFTAEDVPNNKVGHIQQDWDVFIAEGEITRGIGDAICLVVADSPEKVEEAKKLVKIEFEELEPIRTIKDALAEDAPKIHSNGNMCQTRHIARGDAKTALENAKYVVKDTFKTPFTEHAFLEPECAIGFPYKDYLVKVFTTDQGAYDTRQEVAIMFGVEPDEIIIENKLIGGGFGGKEDVSVQHLAALAAVKLQKPVKVSMTRQESINFHPKRHAMEGTFSIGCDENGIFQGMTAEIYFDTGCYASLCGPVLERACTHAVGPYAYDNTDIYGYGVYTNNPPAGAFRGFGVCQSNFAMEALITKLAEEVGISPWEIRYRNAIRPGGVLPNGQITDPSTALAETLEAVKPYFDNNKNVGLACAMKNAGVGVGLPDKGRCRLVVQDGKVEIHSGASCLGQGLGTVLTQITCQTLDIPYDKTKYFNSDTENAPDSGTSSGSRQTLITGEATRMACEKLKADLDGKSLEDLEGKEYFAEYFEPTDPMGSDKPNPKSHIAYGYATHLVVLDDDGKVTDVYAAHGVGKAVNPLSIEGQIDGGVLMSMGYALTEKFPLVDCVPKVKFGSLGLLKANQIPNIHSIIVEKPGIDAAYGAIGLGEIVTIPTAAAIQGAYYAMDGNFRRELPMDETAYSKKKK